jgi:hypothetical protein
MSLVIAIFETLGTNAHTRRQSTRATPIGHIIDIPYQATDKTVIIDFDWWGGAGEW